MDNDLVSVSDLLAVLALVLLNGLFVAAEFALLRSNPSHFKTAESRKKFGARTAQRLLEEMDLALSSIQLGITIASISLGWFGVETLYAMFLSVLGTVGPAAHIEYVQLVLLLVSLAMVVFLHVVLGELVAKSIAIRHSEGTLRLVAGIIFLFAQLCRPAIYLLNNSAELLLKIFGVSRILESNRTHSLAELSFLVAKSTEGGVLDKDEEQMLRGVFGLSDTVAREVMTPRTDLVVIPVESSCEEVVSIIRESGLSRFPVKGDSIDDVVGILLARDLLNFVVPEMLHGSSNKQSFSVRRLMREAYFIPGTKAVDDLLGEFKRRKLHLAIVLDEHGGVDGVVTLEDLIEEIVGDIFDETDIPQKSIVVQDDGDVIIDGGQLVADLNSQFSLEIPEGDYDTIAGFIFTSLGRMPRPGDKILVNKSHQPAADEDVPEPSEQTTDTEKSVQAEAPEEEESASSEQVHPKALITVEKVQSYRIETVRLTPTFTEQLSESPQTGLSSNTLESASDGEV